MNPIRCAIVGLSGIASAPVKQGMGGGRSVLPYSHASALAAIPEAEIIAVCDMVPDLGEKFRHQWQSRWPDMHVYSDLTSMLERETIDVLGICTPDDKHADVLISAVNSGIPAILCEKPLATNLTDADRMIDAVARSGTICAVEHTRRWDPFFHRVKEVLEAGTIGDVKTIVGTLHGERAMMFRNGTHVLDLMCYYAGATPTHVFAKLEEGFEEFRAYRGDGGHDPSSEPGASAFILFDNGIRGFYNGTKGTPSNAEWDIAGTRGRIRISATTLELWTQDTDTGDMVLRPFPAQMVMTGGIQGAYQEVFDALRGSASVRSTPQEARATVALLEGMLASQQQGSRLIELQ